MSGDGPSKSDIQQIFKRLRAAAPNKVCFDCGSKNPTWASITYGIFICIDCSGIHRSLGVHLTFIRSTNLDTNWSWQQLRQMQLGGNAKALTFFRSQNCTSTDTQVKYNSRAAQMYREKLHQSATQAMRLHGTKLHIDTGNEVNEAAVVQEDDFFSQEQEQAVSSSEPQQSAPVSMKLQQNGSKKETVEDEGAPNVELALESTPTVQPAKTAPPTKKSTIGARKPAAKKGGLGAKKGLGATKATRSFAEIEAEAEMADRIATTSRMEVKAVEKNPEDEAKAVASIRLAYQDLSISQQKEAEKMKKSDPAKAAQLERLGMGFGGFGAGGKSHSLVADVVEIVQEEPTNSVSSKSSSNAKEDFFDDFEIVDVDKDDLGWRTSRVDEVCLTSSSNKNSTKAWEQDLNENVRKTSNANNWDNSNTRKSAAISSVTTTDEASKKFANAKAISSDMFFGDQDSGDKDANLSRFQGSTAISSDMYFNRESVGGGGMSRSSSNYSNMQAPDMDEVKESVRQGVHKVAGRLSNMASGVMNQIQDRYGY